VSIKGSPYVRFRGALRTRNVLLIRAAAAELPSVELDDALVICEVLAEKEPERYERAAMRWLGRLCLERPVTLSQIGQAVAALEGLPVDPPGSLRVLRTLSEH